MVCPVELFDSQKEKSSDLVDTCYNLYCASIRIVHSKNLYCAFKLKCMLTGKVKTDQNVAAMFIFHFPALSTMIHIIHQVHFFIIQRLKLPLGLPHQKNTLAI